MGEIWQEKEVKLLRQLIKNHSAEEISKKLKRSKFAIYSKASRLKLKFKIKGKMKKANDDIVKKFTKEELIYLAGLIDGEGSFTILKHKGYYEIYLRIDNTSLQFRDWFLSKGIRVKEEKRPKGWQNKFIVYFRGYKILDLIENLLPYLIIKKPHALIVREFIKKRLELPINIYELGKTWELEKLRKKLILLNSKQRKKLYQLEKKIIQQYSTT